MIEFLIFLIVSFIIISFCIYCSLPKSHFEEMRDYLENCRRIEHRINGGMDED